MLNLCFSTFALYIPLPLNAWDQTLGSPQSFLKKTFWDWFSTFPSLIPIIPFFFEITYLKTKAGDDSWSSNEAALLRLLFWDNALAETISVRPWPRSPLITLCFRWIELLTLPYQISKQTSKIEWYFLWKEYFDDFNWLQVDITLFCYLSNKDSPAKASL